MEERIINQVNKAIGNAIAQEFVKMLTADSFREALKKALNEKLAKILIARMGGELEKQVNQLKGNPETRPRSPWPSQKLLTH